MSSIIEVLGTSTPVSEVLAERLGYMKAAIACRVFFYQQLDQGICYASTKTMARKLGMSTGAISTNLKWLIDNGYIRELGEHKRGHINNQYVVTDKFYAALERSGDERQRSGDERQRSGDERQRSGDELKRSNKESLKDSNNKTDSEFAEICKLYEMEIGGLSPIIRDKILDAVEGYPAAWIQLAIGRAAEMNKRSWGYVEGILKNWAIVGGPQNDKPKGGRNESRQSGNGHHPKRENSLSGCQKQKLGVD